MVLPFYLTTSIQTRLSIEEIKKILHDNTITDEGKTFNDKRVIAWNKKQFHATEKNYLYRAKIKENSFRIYRVPEPSSGGKPSNSFNPLCFAKLCSTDNGCIIKLTFRSIIFVLIFVAVWYAAAIFGILAIFISSLNDNKYKDALFALIFSIPFCFSFWFFNKYGFKKEVERTLNFFENIQLTKTTANKCIAKSAADISQHQHL